MPKTFYGLMFTGFALQLVGAFNETFSRLHWYVSILFFLALLVTTVLYAFEKKSILALIGIGAVVPWVLYAYGIIQVGIAVPEIISAIAVTPWVVHSALKAYSDGDT